MKVDLPCKREQALPLVNGVADCCGQGRTIHSNVIEQKSTHVLI